MGGRNRSIDLIADRFGSSDVRDDGKLTGLLTVPEKVIKVSPKAVLLAMPAEFSIWEIENVGQAARWLSCGRGGVALVYLRGGLSMVGFEDAYRWVKRYEREDQPVDELTALAQRFPGYRFSWKRQWAWADMVKCRPSAETSYRARARNEDMVTMIDVLALGLVGLLRQPFEE